MHGGAPASIAYNGMLTHHDIKHVANVIKADNLLKPATTSSKNSHEDIPALSSDNYSG